jgi:hypothetical protein
MAKISRSETARNSSCPPPPDAMVQAACWRPKEKSPPQEAALAQRNQPWRMTSLWKRTVAATRTTVHWWRLLPIIIHAA